MLLFLFFFKQKTAYEMRISDWSSDVCSSDLGDPFYRVTQITTCATAATCAGTANETKVTIAYNNPNRKPSSVTTASGNGSISSTVGYTYNALGEIATVDGPLSGTADTTYYFYTSNRRLLGTIAPAPDGTGPRKRQAIHHTYIGAKPIQKTEYGRSEEHTSELQSLMRNS